MITERYNIFATEDKWQKIWGSVPQPTVDIDLENLRQKTLDDIVKIYGKKADINLKKYNTSIVNFSEDDNINDIIESYGVDVMRLFFFDSAPDKAFVWNDDVLDGSWRFVKKVWRQVIENLDHHSLIVRTTQAQNKNEVKLQQVTHTTISAFTRSLAKADFNLCVARLHELSNEISNFKKDDDGNVLCQALETLIYLMAPITPHLSAQCWSLFGYNTPITDASWPVPNPQFLTDSMIEIAIHINGKLQSHVKVSNNATKKLIQNTALNNLKIKELLQVKPVNKIIITSNKTINIVAG